MRYPMLIVAFGWLVGLYTASTISISKTILILLLLISMVFFFMSLFVYYRKAKLWFLFFIIAICLTGFIRMDWYQIEHQSQFPEEIMNQPIGLKGYIDSKPIVDGDLVKLMIEPISYQWNNKEYSLETKEKVLVYLFLQEEYEQQIASTWKKGMGIKLIGEIGTPSSAGNPGLFDYQAYLAQKTIYWKVNVEDISKIKVSSGKALFVSFSSFKEKLLRQIDLLFNDPYSGFIKAILLGERHDLSEDIRHDFSILGLSHLLAISGLHLSTLSLMLYWLLTKMRVTHENTVTIISIFLIGYMLLTGASASVVRATIMTVLMFYGLIWKQSISALQVLGIAFIFMTLYNPMWIYDIGFQLSMIITFSILWGFTILIEKLPMKDGMLKKALTLVIITQTASFPFVFYYFHQYSLLSWLLNLLVVPLFSMFIFPVALLIYLLSFLFFPLSHFFASILSELLTILFQWMHWSTSFSFFHFYGGVSSFFWTIMIYILFSWVLLRRKVKEAFISFNLKKIIFWSEKVVFLLLILTIIWVGFFNEEGVIIVIDVGQGDSILIQTPGHYEVLIDSGGKINFEKEEWRKRKDPFDIGEDVVLPFLHTRGLSKLDLAIVTHEDYDHIGGYLSIIDDIKIGTFVVSSEFPRTKYGEELQDKLNEKNINIVHINHQKTVQLDKHTQMLFLPVDVELSSKENNHSFAVYLKMYQTKMLFSGDIESDGEQQLLEQYGLPTVDILKIGHHGSNTSTSKIWLDALEPKAAIISVGLNNLYHHPSAEVINRLQIHEIPIWRTDLDGAVFVHIEEDGYKVEGTKAK